MDTREGQLKMKKATGAYTKVKAITKRQAKDLAKKLFTINHKDYKLHVEGDKLYAEGDKLYAEGDKLHAEGDKLYAEGNKLYAEGDKLYAEGDKLHAEGDKLYAEGDKLYAEGDKLHAEGNKLQVRIVIKYKAYIPDYRAMNLIAKDREDSVYCFVFKRKELWVYNGEDCPNSDTVEKIEY